MEMPSPTPETLRLRMEQLRVHLRTTPDLLASAATTSTPWHEPVVWALDASTPTFLPDPTAAAEPTHNPASIAVALAELRTARKILRSRAILRDPALQPYLDALEASMSLYDNINVHLTDREMNLAVALATARANLQAKMATLPGWLAILHASDAKGDVRPPARFLEEFAPLAAEELSVETLQTWDDLHLLRGD